MRHRQAGSRLRRAVEVVPNSHEFVPADPGHGRKPPPFALVFSLMRENRRFLTANYTGGLRPSQFLAIVCLFWIFVTVSDVLYAYSMRIGISRATNMPLFAAWDTRVLQHAMLLPFLTISYWASLRVQWRPLLAAIPLQIVLGVTFAAIAYPAMILAEILMGAPNMHGHDAEPFTIASMLDPFSLSLWTASFVSFLPAYGFGLALVTGLALYTRFRNSELHIAALEREWSAARLSALRMQLSPHTLFNLLHTIRGYIEWDPKGAQSMVIQLADLLRRLLNAGEQDFARLADELQFVRLYLELQQRRFADRLTVVLPNSQSIPALWVPSLILQPLVENAVVHGLAGHQGPVEIHVTLQIAHETLTLRVANTIAGNKAPGEQGIGINNVRERLAVQFSGLATLTAGAHGTEWISEIVMPEVRDSPERTARRRTAPLVGA